MLLKPIISFILSIIMTFPTLANIEATTNPITIQKLEEDITGDGFNESIELKGLPLSHNSQFFQDIWADIVGINQSWSISYGGGYNPSLDLVYLTHDQTYNLLFRSQSIKNRYSNYNLHIFKGNEIKKIELPQLDFLRGKFIDEFQISIITSPDAQKETVKIDSKPYISEGIYAQDGSLLKPISIKKDPPIFKKHYLSKQQGYGIKSIQKLQDPIQKQDVGKIETLWYFENDKWIILKNNWIPS